MGTGATFSDVSKRFGETMALSGFDLEVSPGELVAVLGPSGCGKSTLLRLTAGLEDLTSGAIHLGERRIDAISAAERDVAMVFQSYALYPHMSVRDNIEFPLRMRSVPDKERRPRVDRVAGLLELDDLLARRPAQLSGGQRQRVALARALVREPALFLLDEPLSNLDARLRIQVRQHVRDVQRRLGVTTLYVTHDQSEAMTLGDRVVVLHDGRVQQAGAPAGVYERPANTFVASFIGMPGMNLVPGRIESDRLHVGPSDVSLPPPLRDAAGPRDVIVGVRPEAFAPAGREDGPSLYVDTEHETREILGNETLVRARIGEHELIVRCFGVVRDLPQRFAAPVGTLHLFRADTGERLGNGDWGVGTGG